jgi:hypothetical protein
MRIAWKIFRAIVCVILLFAVLTPVTLYVMLSLDPVQNYIRNIGQTELTRLLGAEVTIGKVGIRPFNKLDVRNVSLNLGNDSIAAIDDVSAGFELYHFIRTGELVFDYALIDGARFCISKATPESPLNIQPIINHLQKDSPKEEKPFDLRFNTVVIRNAELSYDVLSETLCDSARFCPSHIRVSKLAVNAYIPQISNNLYRVHLDHLSFAERSGFHLDELRAKVDFGKTGMKLYDFSLDLPASHICLSPIEFAFNGYKDILNALQHQKLHIATCDECEVTLSDLRAFVPQLGAINSRLSLALDAEGTLDNAHLNRLAVSGTGNNGFTLSLAADATSLLDKEKLTYDLDYLNISASGQDIEKLLSTLLPPKTAEAISKLPQYTIHAAGKGSLSSGMASVIAESEAGSADFEGKYTVSGLGSPKPSYMLDGDLSVEDIDLGSFLSNPELGVLSASATGKVRLGNIREADFNADIRRLGFHGYDYTGITASLQLERGNKAEVNLSVDDPSVKLLAYGFVETDKKRHNINATATASMIDLYALGFDKTHEGYRFGTKLNINGTGSDADDISGTAEIFDLRWTDDKNEGLKIDRIVASAKPEGPTPTIEFDSDIFTGRLWGEYSFRTLVPQLSRIAADFFPALFEGHTIPKSGLSDIQNNFRFDFTLLPSEKVTEFLGLPFHVMDDVSIEGFTDIRTGRANINISAPYLRQGNKLFENTDVFASLDREKQSSKIYLTTQFATKKGDMVVSALLQGAGNRLDTHVDWTLDRAIPINGNFDFSTLFRKPFGKKPGESFPLDALINFNPGTINFGDETWKIQTSTIDITPARITVDNFSLDSPGQSIAIDGTIGPDDTDNLAVNLDKISLLPIFETLEIDNALLSGRASGKFSARNLLGKAPVLTCPDLHVDSIGYQRCTMGDADIRVAWDNPEQAFTLDADITGFEGHKSTILGAIMPMKEALDIDFYADSIPVDFLKPFMSAFTSSITGRASGHARLFGTFHDMNLEGDVFADNVKLKVDFTGTTYSATDSIHMKPGLIELKNITIRDIYGKTAKLNGYVHHQCFHLPDFKFDITDARDFLSYNTTSRDNPDWYGTIFGNGSASVSGYPGVVNIDVNMSTAPKSTFTFVLSDRLDAEDYSFLTFRDVTPDSVRTHQPEPDYTPLAVKAFKSKVAAGEDQPSKYNMDILVDITKDATMTLVMDPIGGDEIKAHGEGNLHMAYHSANNDLNIWGKYTLADGTYRFTLQDIIIKDFTIKEGSSIQFDGDPYGVKTNLEAYYGTNANLTDLDESFLQDKDIARTNVPVHALMKVTGDIRQPAIDFDLEFPTLTSDTYRKVRSIVSTSDMMNRQIIYLLALNRFYTPDYMASTTKGSELFSVASSTISSQLGSMLGKLSDNWTVAPNLRSDRGDFSDVEVDVALSSRLLNNRLIFNGNFGYRDKSLNSNQFIGDFDIEYLLNKRGSWRLKAYNRYNDRNYYIRSAQTTQGVGVVFRRDFDNLFSFLKKNKKKKDEAASDSTSRSLRLPVTKPELPDSIKPQDK